MSCKKLTDDCLNTSVNVSLKELVAFEISLKWSGTILKQNTEIEIHSGHAFQKT